MKFREKHNLYLVFILIVVFLLPFLIVLHNIFNGNINFWYDPARDFLLGWDNLSKLTLIGPTTGIPGIFYGPYWVWLISIGLFFSKDPTIVIFLILTLPYFIILPFVLYKFRKIFRLETVIIVWLLFILNKGIYYAENPWNPHPAPLLFFILVYFTVLTNFSENRYLKSLIIGLLSGLVVNFHVSFGLGVSAGVFFFFLTSFVREMRVGQIKRKKLFINLVQRLSIFILGIFITFLPFVVFEIRHGFGQVKTAINLLTARGSMVEVTGLSKELIIQNFFGATSDLLKIPSILGNLFLICGILYLIYQFRKKKIQFQGSEVKLIVLLFCVTIAILALYLTSKNPVWGYHFIGVEVIMLFDIGTVKKADKIIADLMHDKKIKNANIAALGSKAPDNFAVNLRNTLQIKNVNFLAASQYGVSEQLLVLSTSDEKSLRLDQAYAMQQFKNARLGGTYLVENSIWKIYWFRKI